MPAARRHTGFQGPSPVAGRMNLDPEIHPEACDFPVLRCSTGTESTESVCVVTELVPERGVRGK